MRHSNKMAALRWNNLNVFCGILLTLHVFLVVGTNGQNYASCSSGWIAFEKDSPHTCLWISDSQASSLDTASNECGKKNASLIVIQSQAKLDVFKKTVDNSLGSSTHVWVGLKKYNDGLKWLTKDGLIPATSLPFDLQNVNWNHHYNYYHSYSSLRVQYYSQSFQISSDYARYICEKRRVCKKGWFGLDCDQECHCHGQDCGTDAVEIACQYGCQVGWMGKGCSQQKEDAVVSYFCVNAEGQGKYAHVQIDTKGVYYENIHAVDKDGESHAWCNNTSIEKDSVFSLETIKIYVDNQTDNEVKDGICAGTIDTDGKYEWTIRIQEKDGLVSRNDQEVRIECNFANADDFSLSGKTSLKREKWFRRKEVRKPIEYLDETKESLDIQVVDPSTGDLVSQAEIGSSVVLRIRFNLAEDNSATGVTPFNCYASAPDGKQTVMFLSEKGCSLVGSPVSSFVKNGSKSLITQPFPLFGFDGATDVNFHCSYKLCFGAEECALSCHQTNETSIHNVTRRRRSATENKLMGSVELVSDNEITRVISFQKGDRLKVHNGDPLSNSHRVLNAEHFFLVCTVTMAMMAVWRY